MNPAGGDPRGQVCDAGGWVLCCQGAAQLSLVTSVHLFSQVGLRVASAQRGSDAIKLQNTPCLLVPRSRIGALLLLSKPWCSPNILLAV